MRIVLQPRYAWRWWPERTSFHPIARERLIPFQSTGARVVDLDRSRLMHHLDVGPLRFVWETRAGTKDDPELAHTPNPPSPAT